MFVRDMEAEISPVCAYVFFQRVREALPKIATDICNFAKIFFMTFLPIALAAGLLLLHCGKVITLGSPSYQFETTICAISMMWIGAIRMRDLVRDLDHIIHNFFRHM